MRLKKQASFIGRTFTIDKLAQLDENQEMRILLALMMVVLLERSRG
jgi:hypothetical protein